MRQRPTSTSGWLLLLPLLWGCVFAQTTNGTPLSWAQIDEIVPGTSTRADVTALLGAPDEIIYSNLEHDPLFERAYEYRRTKTRSTFFTIIIFSTARRDKNFDHAVIFFDDEGVVEDVSARLDMDAPRYGSPFK